MQIRFFLLLLFCLTLTGCDAVVSGNFFSMTPRAKAGAKAKSISKDWYFGGEDYEKARAEATVMKASSALYF